MLMIQSNGLLLKLPHPDEPGPAQSVQPEQEHLETSWAEQSHTRDFH